VTGFKECHQRKEKDGIGTKPWGTHNWLHLLYVRAAKEQSKSVSLTHVIFYLNELAVNLLDGAYFIASNLVETCNAYGWDPLETGSSRL